MRYAFFIIHPEINAPCGGVLSSFIQKRMDFSLYFLDGVGNLGDAVVGETPIYPVVPIVTTRGGIHLYVYTGESIRPSSFLIGIYTGATASREKEQYKSRIGWRRRAKGTQKKCNSSMTRTTDEITAVPSQSKKVFY